MKLLYKGKNYALVAGTDLKPDCPGIRQSYINDGSGLINSFDNYDAIHGAYTAQDSYGYIFHEVSMYMNHPYFIVRMKDLHKYYKYSENEFGMEVP